MVFGLTHFYFYSSLALSLPLSHSLSLYFIAFFFSHFIFKFNQILCFEASFSKTAYTFNSWIVATEHGAKWKIGESKREKQIEEEKKSRYYIRIIHLMPRQSSLNGFLFLFNSIIEFNSIQFDAQFSVSLSVLFSRTKKKREEKRNLWNERKNERTNKNNQIERERERV